MKSLKGLTVKGRILFAACLFSLSFFIASCKGNLINNSDNDASNKAGLKQADEIYSFSDGLGFVNYGDQNQLWLKKLRSLAKNKKEVFRIVILGDSHVAGGYLGDTVRENLQRRLGDAGIGWVHPNRVHGQRQTSLSYGGNWVTKTCRRDGGGFPLGGVITYNDGGDIIFDFAPKAEISGAMTLKLIMGQRGDIGDNAPFLIYDCNGKRAELPQDFSGRKEWRHLSFENMTPPINFLDMHKKWIIGGIGLENGESGVTVSAMGINGAQMSDINKKWRRNWLQDLAFTKPDLVVFAYGTNEAYGRKELDIVSMEREWQSVIDQVRGDLPDTGILIVGAPESLQNKKSDCGRPIFLDDVQQMQERIARKNKTLYWSWEKAMGGRCSMRLWIDGGLAAKDGVHFSADGYRQIGMQLAYAVLKLASP